MHKYANHGDATKMIKRVFIDGGAGTTGLVIRERLAERDDIQLNILPEALRKSPEARKEMLNEADIAFFCLPDAAAIEAAGWCKNPNTVIIDTSTAHRCDNDWTYGFPELSDSEGGKLRHQIRISKRIANPGCHASGFIALTAPLIQAGFLPADAMLTCFSLTGYSGGGRKMIEEYESVSGDSQGLPEPYASPRQYGLSQNHKHLPEMVKLAGLKCAPVFCPVVASFKRGMEVTVPLFADQLAKERGNSTDTALGVIQEIYADYYKGSIVHFNPEGSENGFLAAGKMAGQDDMEIAVFGNEERILLTARFDNLGKGACGAAIQNMNLVLGVEETTGLVL